MNNILKNNNTPIGIFDSGLGGLSICKEIVKILPNESIIYLADSLNAPYGEKTKQQIIDLSIKNTELLLSYGCKIIVVACNTATTNAISVLRSMFNIPFIGIEPATKLAAINTKTGKIGVLATKGTLKSELFINTSEQYRNRIEIIEAEGFNLVRLIEKGDLDATIPLLKKYLKPMLDSGVDSIVLGCTHYPFLIPIIKSIVPANLKIVDSGEAVAKQTLKVLQDKNLCLMENNIKHTVFYTNKDVETLSLFLARIELEYDEVAKKIF